MPHESPADPKNHSTIEIKDENGAPLANGHLTTDPNKQEVNTCSGLLSAEHKLVNYT
jgi:hypothetical protein